MNITSTIKLCFLTLMLCAYSSLNAQCPVTFTAPADMFVTDPTDVHSLLGTPTGGTYSGPGVTNIGDGVNFLFNPAAAGVGVHTLTYTASGGACSAMDDIEVFAAPSVDFTAPADLCINAGVQAGLGGGTPTGGVYSGTGVTDDGNGMTYSFDPAAAGVGVHTITYTENMISAMDDVEVLALPVPTFTAPADVNIGDPVSAHNLLGSPTGGVYSGPGVTDLGNGISFTFDPAVAGVGIHMLTYTFSSVPGCTGLASDMIEVIAPAVDFTAPADLCINAGVQSALGGGTPTGGVYSGAGVTDDGNGMTYSFDPAVAGVGVHTITYTESMISAMDDVEVLGFPEVTFAAPADVCLTDAISLHSLLGSPTGGVYSGAGVTNIGDGVNFTFDPAVAGVGVHTITYTADCSATAMDDIEVFAVPMAAFTAPADLCVDAGVQSGLGGGTPTGGTYSGTGVSDDANGMTYSFDPAAAGVGTHTITYAVSGAPCPDPSAMDDVEVFGLPSVTFTALADLCLNDGVQTGLGGGSPTGGIYSGPGVSDDANGMTYSFDPAAAGVGVHTLAYNVTDVNGCSGAASDNVEVFAPPTVTFTAPADMCLDAPAGIQSLLGSPSGAGGAFSGPGVTDIGDGVNFIFTPAVAGVGTHTLTYTYTDGNGCSATATDDIEIFALPTVTFTAPTDLCIDAGVQTGLGGGMPTGGVYSGTGVTNDGNGMTYSFDPAVAGVGVHTITYDFTDANGCAGSASDDVEVFDIPVVNLATAVQYCLDAPIIGVAITGGSPSGGVYSGPGVTDLGNGISYNLDPTVGGPGIITITYTITNADGCSASAMSDINIIDCGFEITDPCNCLDNATVIDLDAGTGGDDGQFSEIVSVTDATGGMLPAGQTWTVVGATGAFDAYNIPAIGVQSAGVLVATDGSVTLTHNGQTGVYELPFVHVDEMGYTMMVEGPFPMGSAANVTLTVANNCTYPNPVFDPALLDTFCFADMPLALGGMDSNGVGADGVTFTVDGMPATDLDISSPGMFTVVMTFDGADDGNGGVSPDGGTTPASPGCIQTVQKVVEVIAIQNPVITCPADTTIDCGVPTDMGLGMATAMDDCGGNQTIDFSDMTVPGICPAVDTIYRTWTATDDMMNVISCVQTITVQDTTAPLFLAMPLPPDDINCSDPLPDQFNLVAQDGCGNTPTVTPSVEMSGDACGGVLVTYRWIAEDDCGNQNITETTFNILPDTTAPVFDQPIPNDTMIDCTEMIPDAAVITATDDCTGGGADVAMINEIHYDNSGGDVGEFVEVAGTAGFDLSACELVLYNGNGGASYNTVPLAGMIPDEGGGFGAISFPIAGIQNGSPDGIALVCGGMVIEFLSYEGGMTATDGPAMGMMSTDIGVSETSGSNAGESLQRTGMGMVASDFTWTGPLAESPGLLNAGQSVSAAAGIVVAFNETILPGVCASQDTIRRIWSAADGCANMVADTQFIYILDDAQPTFTSPADTTINCEVNPGTVDMVTDLADACGSATATFIDRVDLSGCGGYTGTITRIWTVSDDCGNDTMFNQIITVQDTTPPTFTVPEDITLAGHQDPYDLMTTGDVTDAMDNCTGVIPTMVWINEIHYDDAGGDNDEMIEVAGTAGADLSTCELYVYNGANGTTYGDMTLAGTIPDEGLGFGAISFAYPTNGIQNGAPDGVALICDGVVIEFLSYEGNFMATDGPAMGMMSTDIGVSEAGDPEGMSLQLTGMGSASADFTWTGPAAASPGVLNSGQTMVALPAPSMVVVDYTNVEDLDASGTGTITRTWTATDDCDNETVMVQVITIITCALTCPEDVILNLEAGECYEVASIIQPTITGDCADVIIPDTTMGFVDAFDPGNASLILNDVCGGVDLSGIPGTLSLTSSDICGTDPVGCSGQAQQNDCAFVATLISFTAPTNGLFSFDWDYLNSDNVSDDNDNFGYAVGDVNTLTFGQVTQLNEGIIFVDDPAAQNGSEVDIPVSAGQDIVFIIYDFSGCCGTATADITNFIFVEIPVQVYEIVQSCGPMDGDLLEPGTYEVCFDLLFGGMVDTTCSYNITVNEYAGPVETDLICNGALNLSIDADCMVTIRADDLLEGGPYMCYDDYEITLAEHPALGDVNGVSINLPPGTSVTATVTDPNTGNSCWVTLNIEYKFPPQLQCPCEDPIFDLDGVLETTDASVDFSALACTNPVTTFDGLTTYDVAVFSITNAGDFTFEMAGLGDGLAYLFEGVFDGTCSATLVEGDDDDGVGLNPRIEASLAPGTYSLVSTHTTFNTTLGAYTWAVTAEIAGCDNTCEDFDAFIADPSLGGAPAFVGGCTTVEDYTFTDVVDEQLCETSTVTRTFIVTDNLGNTASCVAVYEFISTGSFDFPADLDGIDNEALQCDEYCGNVSGGWAYHYDDEYPGLKIPSPDADGNCPGSGRPGGSGCDFIQSAYWDHIIPVCDLQYGQDQAAYWGTYKIVRHWIISNWCTGEVEEMNQLIKIEDNDPPVVTCPDDVTVGVTGHDCDRDLMRLPYPEVEDGCGHAYATPYVHTAEGEEVVPGPYFDSRDRLYAQGEDWFVKDLPLGHNLAKWIATDGCNNYDTCEYYIIVEDLTPPVAVCESFRQVSLTEDGYAKVFAEAFDDGSNDNCGPVYFKVRREVIGGCDRINGDDSPAPGYQEWYDDYVKFCCEDVGEPVIVRLRVYDVDPGEGPVSPGAYAGHWNECWSEVTVEDKLPPAISCPADMTVSCDNDLLLSDLENNDADNPYGYAIGFDNCDVEITVRAAEPVDCGSDNRFFTRTFTARDPDGRTARCTQRIYLIEDPFTICDTESRCEPLQSLNVVCRSGGHTNRDNAEWPCDLVLEECGLGLDPWQLAANPANARDANGNRIALNAYPRYDNAGPLNGQILGIYPYACAQIAIDSSDQVFTLVEDACLKILRTWTVIDWCQFDAITRDPDDPDRFVGYWEYIQIIKVRNTVGPTFNDPGETDFCDESTPDCLVSVTLTSGAEDDCTPEDQLHYAWAVDYFSDGSYDLTGNGPTFSRRVEQSHPYGLNGPGTPHTIRWTVEDGCDNTTVNEYTFTTVECKKPTPYCDNGIAIVVMPSSGSIAVWANDLDAGSFDNCTEQENLIFTIRKIVDGEPVGIPTPSLTLDCSCMPNGVSETINVEIWVEDEAGNRDNCDTYILLQDTPDADMPEGVCPDDNPVPLVSGTVATEEGVSAPLHEVRLLGSDDQIVEVDFTNVNGEYAFGSLGGAYVQPVNNTNTALGLSTLDLIAIQQHILGIDALDSPYKMVAADATNDHTINVLDLLEVQKVILGLQPEFTNNQSWRYVSADEEMDMINPYTFEEPVAIPSYTDQDNIVEDFIAVKIGDVNGTAIGVAGVIERSGLVFEVNDAKVTYQDDIQEIRVPVTSSNFTSIDGYQFTVDFDQTNLTFVRIESGALTINPANVGVHASGEVATNWYNEKAETVAAEEVLFTLIFRGESIESLTFNGAITSAESYRDGQIQSVNLVFTGNTAETFALYQNEPNPFKETTMIMFDLPSAAATTLTVFDVNGKTLMVQNIDGQAGYNEYLIKKAQLNNAAGVMYYRVDTDDYTATKKMISIK